MRRSRSASMSRASRGSTTTPSFELRRGRLLADAVGPIEPLGGLLEDAADDDELEADVVERAGERRLDALVVSASIEAAVDASGH